MELDDSLDIPWSSLKPTMQAVLWLSDMVAKYQLRPDVVLGPWECGMSTHAESDDDSDVLPKNLVGNLQGNCHDSYEDVVEVGTKHP